MLPTRWAPRSSPRWRAQRMLWDGAPRQAVLLYACAAVGALAPVVLLVGVGRIVRAAAGDRQATWPWIAVSGAAIGVLLVGDTVRDHVAGIARARLTFALQERLMTALIRPAGIAHLTDQGNLDALAGAKGALTGFQPANAPLTQVALAGDRLGGLAACVLVGAFRWWLGAGLLLVWLAVRRPLRTVITEHVAALGGDAGKIRRAVYFFELATDPAAAPEVRAYGLGRWTVDRLREHWLLAMAAAWSVRARVYRTVALTAGLVVAANLAACWVLADAVAHHRIGLAELAAYFPAIVATSAVGGISTEDIALAWMLASLPDVERLEAGIARSAVPLGGARPVGDLPRRTIRLEGVRFAFGDRPVLDGLDLDIPVGASTAIVGANGAGKTTLIRLLTRLHDPSGGRITVDGTDLADLDPADWQRRCALISQDFARLPFTLADNIGVGASRAALRAAAERAGAADLVAGLPDGWDTPLGVPGGRDLSRGQWQRVALARALYAAEHGARILVLDEPTAWLDAAAEADFHRRFLAMTRGLTTIIVAHRFSTVRRADRIHVLHDGKVAESGDHDTLLALDGRYAAMFTAQAARFAGEATAR